MKRLLMPLMLATLTSVASFADDNRFSRETFTLGGTTLHFRLADIRHNVTENSILVLYLHGGSARGDDNEAQLCEAAVSVIYQYLYSHQIPATFIVPQCPSGGGWTGQLRRVVNEMVKSYANDGSNTGINVITSATHSSVPIYDLWGRKVSTPTKSIYLIDGKKVIVK